MNEYVCVDVETTGLSPESAELIEVCAIRFNDDGQILDKFHHYCSPIDGVISNKITSINGITEEMVKGKPNYFKDGIQKQLAKFIGDTTLIGHNLIGFDHGFIKIDPPDMEDTLIMARQRWRGQKNNLESACKRAKIKFNAKEAHSAEYDVLRTIDLYLFLTGKHVIQLDVFEENKVEKVKTDNVEKKIVQEKEEEKEEDTGEALPTAEFLPTQAYSYSRLNLFQTCPFKWYKQYIEKVQEPGYPHFTTGRICHTVAELSAMWCYVENFANRFDQYAVKVKKVDMDEGKREELINEVRGWSGEEKVTRKLIGKYIFNYPGKIKEFMNYRSMTHLLNEMYDKVPDDSFEKASMPDRETFNNFLQTGLNKERCTDPSIIKDCEFILNGFFERKDYALSTGEMALAERKLSFDKDWNLLKKWIGDDIFFRGVLDLVEYLGDYVIITDYKTSRKMLAEDQLKNDMQLKVYALLVYHFLPEGAVKKLILRHDYMRYNKTIEYEVGDIKTMVNEAKKWIFDTVTEIEKLLAGGLDNFKPNRNQFCGTCFLAEEGVCPLFSKRYLNNIDDIENFKVGNKEDCQTAWKRIEANKAEIKNLSRKCKEFLKSKEDVVDIDENAKLDFWISETEDYNAYQMTKLLTKKKVKVTDFIKYFNLTTSNFEKMKGKLGLEFTEDELDIIMKKGSKSVFDAFTKKGAEEKGFINIIE